MKTETLPLADIPMGTYEWLLHRTGDGRATWPELPFMAESDQPEIDPKLTFRHYLKGWTQKLENALPTRDVGISCHTTCGVPCIRVRWRVT